MAKKPVSKRKPRFGSKEWQQRYNPRVKRKAARGKKKT